MGSDVMSQLVQYILAYRRPGGGKLAMFGAQVVSVPFFPPDATVRLNFYPIGNAYMNIWFWLRYSPAMVPGVFTIDVRNEGLEVQIGTLTEITYADSVNHWIETTAASPILYTVSNISGMAQRFETAGAYLSIRSREDALETFDLISRWSNNSGVEGLLKQLVGGRR